MLKIDLGQPIPSALQNGVVAIGNFDGAHRGHQILFELARRRARDLDAPFVILTFDPHPRRFFKPDSPAFLLTPGDLKIDRLGASLCDGVVTLNFNHDLANHPAHAFIDEILRDYLHARHIFVGRDFHFGHNRNGTVETLMASGLGITAVNLMADRSGKPYSSTRIRQLLQAGDMEGANRLLGWNWEIRGPIIHGDRRGHELGYPTANVQLGETLAPAYGVYAARVWIDHYPAGRWLPAAVNIGIRPMFEAKAPLAEAHILDFKDEIYGKILRIQPVRKLRDEAKFPDLPALIDQIGKDCATTRALLSGLAQAA